MSNVKTDQLRVRLTKDERKQLEQTIKSRGENETISDIVRKALQWCISPEKGMQPVYVSKDTKCAISVLAEELKRSESQVLADCVTGIYEIANDDSENPLIVKEIHIRRNHKA